MLDFVLVAIPEIMGNCSVVLTKGFDQNQNFYPVSLSHLVPCTDWIGSFQAEEEICTDFFSVRAGRRPRLIDAGTKEEYVLDSIDTKRVKCLLLIPASILFHSLSLLFAVANRVAKIVTLSYFWYPSLNPTDSLKIRVFELLKDVLKVVLTPILYLGFILTASYGVLKPYDGGKLYATIERIAFGTAILAPCFQPNPQSHLGGGDIDIPDSW